jgi:hypothetical protein
MVQLMDCLEESLALGAIFQVQVEITLLFLIQIRLF